MLKLIPFAEKLTSEQLDISQEFETLIEQEFDLCIQQIQKIELAINLEQNLTENQHYANRHLSSIQQYWQQRLQLLFNFLETKNCNLSEKMLQKYLTIRR